MLPLSIPLDHLSPRHRATSLVSNRATDASLELPFARLASYGTGSTNGRDDRDGPNGSASERTLPNQFPSTER
jgi:hypothetical protein